MRLEKTISWFCLLVDTVGSWGGRHVFLDICRECFCGGEQEREAWVVLETSLFTSKTTSWVPFVAEFSSIVGRKTKRTADEWTTKTVSDSEEVNKPKSNVIYLYDDAVGAMTTIHVGKQSLVNNNNTPTIPK